MTKVFYCILALLSLVMSNIQAQELTYQNPPSIIASLADGILTPDVALSPDKKTFILLHRPGLPSISEVAAEELRLGGLRIDPLTNGGSRTHYYHDLTLQSLDGGKPVAIKNIPASPKLENISWSPDGSKLAFTQTRSEGIELWIVDVSTATARKIPGISINDAMAMMPYRWFSDSKHLLLQTIDKERGQRPRQVNTQSGPIVQENVKGAAPNRTFQDLIKSPHDEALFAYYTYSDLQIYSVGDDRLADFQVGGIITGVQISPDGNYLLVHELKRPFSYSVPYYRFAKKSTIYNRAGEYIRTIADLPAAEHLPKGFNAVVEGPRQFTWRSDHGATLCWVEAQDGGDPAKKAAIRDQLFTLSAPFVEAPRPSVYCSLRYRNVIWGDGQLAIIRESWWRNRREITSVWQPDGKDPDKETLFDRSYEDRYSDPGFFQIERNEYGRSKLMRSPSGLLYLFGMGASEAGNRPFIDTFDPSSKKTTRLWRSEAPYYEVPMNILDKEKGLVITRRESKEDPPNYFVRDLDDQTLRALTDFEDPYQAMRGIKKDLIKYQRKDGIELTGTLYLPAGFTPGEDDRLPVLMWAYPREFKSKSAASQVRNSPYEFLRLYPGSPVFWALRGYAVLDNFSMPIVGEGQDEPNETFVPQLVEGAEAAVDKLVKMGVADPDRIAVGGHSYGAFMAANLLAHTDLFAAGIARSGAYNRTLTPFGFQSEERTFWEVPDIYFGMSPFMHADKIKEPLLLLHGDADNNAGTYPMQSERFYAALKGHGATTRLVMLPHESHGYRARESVMHMLWEMDEWLEKYVKKASER
ncbi:MAG: S9 family peptidase [Saprospiraceae bacterium]|nr:S9 family peptidase [Saprospiraceae bacterium]